jgi:hypothetical protein
VAEGTSLLRMHTAYTCIVGSNPTVSASIKKKAPTSGAFFSPFHRGKSKKVVRRGATLFSYIRLRLVGRKVGKAPWLVRSINSPPYW